MIEMFNTYARPVRDLRNNYPEIAALANAGNQVMITNNGREEVFVIGKEDYRRYEEFIHRRYVAEELAQSEIEANDPQTQWLSHEEAWKRIEG